MHCFIFKNFEIELLFKNFSYRVKLDILFDILFDQWEAC